MSQTAAEAGRGLNGVICPGLIPGDGSCGWDRGRVGLSEE